MDELTKEELIKTPKKKHRWMFIVYSVLCILSMVNCAIYVSGKSVHLCITLCLYWVLFLIYRKSWLTRVSSLGIGIVIFVICFFLGMYLDSNVTYRHPWQYERAMAPFRQDYEKNVAYFPETIPDCASNVRFRVCTPSDIDERFVTLSFTADDAYLQECKEKFLLLYFEFKDYNIENAPAYAVKEWKEYRYDVDLYSLFETYYRIYTYKSTIKISHEEAFEPVMECFFPKGICITKEELHSAKIYYTSLRQGFIIVEDTNRIIFFRNYRD